jgi:hypothetical protein
MPTTREIRLTLLHALTEGKPLTIREARALVRDYGAAMYEQGLWTGNARTLQTVYDRWVASCMPTHPYAGHSKERAERGDPGHCERCCQLGHVVAHPKLGCGDVGCTKGHKEGIADGS